MAKKHENTTTFLKREDVQRRWFILDAKGKTLGRFCQEVARILRGKHRVDFTPHTDCGDGVLVVNADKIKVTGNKRAQKTYHYYTGHIGGLREIPFEVMAARKPQYIIEHAVKGMLPHTRQGRKQLKRLRIFKGEEHGHDAQQPIKANI